MSDGKWSVVFHRSDVSEPVVAILVGVHSVRFRSSWSRTASGAQQDRTLRELPLVPELRHGIGKSFGGGNEEVSG